MSDLDFMALRFDIAALVIFFVCWFGYEHVIRLLSKRRGMLLKDLTVVRHAWMREMVIRDFKLFDSNLIGHGVNSASFFASANLILIAAIGGALFSTDVTFQYATGLGIDTSSSLLVLKLSLVIVCLARGLLNFIWALRQMNYCVAAFGAIPLNVDKDTADKFTEAASDIIDPAMSNFSQGVRGYYFSLAAGAWLFGPWALVIASIGAVFLLGWRQASSQASRGLRRMRELLEEHPYPTRTRPLYENDPAPLEDILAMHKDHRAHPIPQKGSSPSENP
ncbi:MAG: hypothetical protein B7Z26_02135 [Asticcacaulis sp. 32-58-5]|nr:MAG: hypothetical protein B7Z26_02135 [Asticcacaulis sp. 32-58-5]